MGRKAYRRRQYKARRRARLHTPPQEVPTGPVLLPTVAKALWVEQRRLRPEYGRRFLDAIERFKARRQP